MELELNRVDYAIVGLTTSKCLKLLPPSAPKMAQKIVIGDQDGVLHIFSIKKGEIQVILKTSGGPKITRLDLGGNLDNVQDKIFISCDSEVKGFTKKGKQFLGFDTNLTESISAMCVLESHLFVTGLHNFYQYTDLKEANYFNCGEVIKDLLVVVSSETKSLMPILACNDRAIRVLEDSHLLYSVPVSSCPTVLYDFLKSDQGENQVIYGTSDGGVGLLLIGKELKNSWLLEPNSNKGQVTSLEAYDLTGDEHKELILGRDDGFIEVYKINENDENPKLIYSYTCNETVTCLAAGIIGTNECPELVVSTYSGWIFSLTTEPLNKNLALSVDSNHLKLSQQAKHKINKLKSEIEDLEERVSQERNKFQAASELNENALSTIPAFDINDKFYLNKEDASYNLSIEVQTSIDNILVHSDVPLDLLDVDKNSAVVSFSDCNPSDGNFLLATYRCQQNTTRLDLKIRTIEGQYGILQAYITPNIQPKCCQLRMYRIKPLSLHTRIHAFDINRPHNVLTFRGGFSFAEIHSWLEFCLPEVPSKPPPDDSAIIIFCSTFLETILQCNYSKGEAQFKSDNVSTISIIKDVICKEATKNKKKRNLDISWEINEMSVKHTLDLLRPKLERQLDLTYKVAILEAMMELDLGAFPETTLTDEYTEILKNEKVILEEYKRHPGYLDRLCGMVTDLYIDKSKFLGINVKGKIPALLEILKKEKYSFDKLLEFFNK